MLRVIIFKWKGKENLNRKKKKTSLEKRKQALQTKHNSEMPTFLKVVSIIDYSQKLRQFRKPLNAYIQVSRNNPRDQEI